jgi:hypothetical protein
MNNLPILTEKAKYAFCVQLINDKQKLEEDYLSFAAKLYRAKTERLYEAGWTSWEEYVEEFKFRNSKTTVHNLFRIHEEYVVRFGFSPKQLAEAGGWTCISETLPLIGEETTRRQAEEFLDLSKVQTRNHLRTTVKDIRRGRPCGHKTKRKLVLEICVDCNERWSVEEDK